MPFTLDHLIRLTSPRLYRGGLIKLQCRSLKSLFSRINEDKERGWMSRFVRVKTSDLIPADWMLFLEEWNMKRLGDAIELRPGPTGEVEAPKLPKERKKRRESSENPPKLKKSLARRPKEEEEDDDCLLVNRKRKNVDALKPTEPVVVDLAHSRAEAISEGSSNKVPEPSSRKKAPRSGDHYEGDAEQLDPEPLQIKENAPSGSLGVINVDDSPPGPEFSEGQIQEALNMRSSEVEASHEGHDIFQECLVGLEDGPDPDASFIFDEARKLFKQAVVLHKKAFSKSRDDLARCEAELKNTLEERGAVKALYAKKEVEIYDLRVELMQACQGRAEYVEKFYQKADLEAQLREELKTKEAEALRWRQGMDDLASEKETLKEQLASPERQLRGAKEENLETIPEDDPRGDTCSRLRSFSDIEAEKILEEETAVLLSDEDDSASVSESEGDGDEVPEGEAPKDVTPEDAAAKDVTPK
ncbi:PREDICTED: uncharacterized protein LOC109234929 [Nicotiana attenuata]|uniref:uncharacterized protein LOC109221552 n=1 Tax=Nicotiana attenuata TaxID=49451 RepID=UPI000905B0DA|nr:PREDICTED: uncharacterized protein LOC109221552 [Nicotiana attenuata]XP_019256513.1 PREDICTED: uncharacterized protein LOC109234929 [Nicotiana attenuata]